MTFKTLAVAVILAGATPALADPPATHPCKASITSDMSEKKIKFFTDGLSPSPLLVCRLEDENGALGPSPHDKGPCYDLWEVSFASACKLVVTPGIKLSNGRTYPHLYKWIQPTP